MRTGDRPRRSRVLAAIAGALLLAIAHGAFAANATELAETVARQETQRATARALDRQIARLQGRLERLRTEPAANAEAIANARSKLAALTSERLTVATRVESLAALLTEQRDAFIEATGADRSELAARLGALRDLEAARALLQRQIATIRREISALQRAPRPDTAAIARLDTALDARLAELDACQARIASARTALSTLAVPTGAGGKAVLHWSVPTTRENGDPLPSSELAGYEIYILAESTGDTETIPVEDPLATTYTVDDLAPGTYHFSMAAKDTAGTLSALSTVVSKTIAP